MSFSEIKKTEDEKEYIEEITTKTEETRKIYSRSGLLNDIEDIDAQILELQARRVVLEEQLTKFKEVKATEL
jgi:hypothetical protein